MKPFWSPVLFRLLSRLSGFWFQEVVAFIALTSPAFDSEIRRRLNPDLFRLKFDCRFSLCIAHLSLDLALRSFLLLRFEFVSPSNLLYSLKVTDYSFRILDVIRSIVGVCSLLWWSFDLSVYAFGFVVIRLCWRSSVAVPLCWLRWKTTVGFLNVFHASFVDRTCGGWLINSSSTDFFLLDLWPQAVSFSWVFWALC